MSFLAHAGQHQVGNGSGPARNASNSVGSMIVRSWSSLCTSVSFRSSILLLHGGRDPAMVWGRPGGCNQHLPGMAIKHERRSAHRSAVAGRPLFGFNPFAHVATHTGVYRT